MARMLYNVPGDNIIANATMTQRHGAAVAGFSLTNIRDLSPASPFKVNTDQVFIEFDFGSPVSCPLIFIGHHNLRAGFTVRWRGNASAFPTSPGPWPSTFDAPIVAGAVDPDGYKPNIYADVSAVVNYGAYRYWGLDCVTTSNNNGVNIIIGEVWIGSAIRRLTHNFSWGFGRRDHFPGRTSFKTSGGVPWTQAGFGRQRELIGECETSDAGLATLVAFNRVCGGATGRSAIIVPETPDGADAWLARWTVDLNFTGPFTQDNVVELGFLEDARGPAV